MSHDFYKVSTACLALAVILQQAILGNALVRLESIISDIELAAINEGGENGGWVLIELRNGNLDESGGEK